MKTYILLLAIVVQVLALEDTRLDLEDKCPKEDISPCTCKNYFDGACIIACGLSSQSTIDKLADIPNLCNGHVHFILVHSKISGIPAKLWKTLLSSQTVDISIKHSGIEGLIPNGGESIPEVSTPGAAVIKIDHAKVGRWDWKQLGKFYSEGELTLIVDDTPLPDVSSDFNQIAKGNVHKVHLDSAGLTEIPEKLFANFEDINSLSLQNNKLTSVSRSMLPRPASKMQFLHLNGNLLTSLPVDVFADMPLLEVVYLRDNKLTQLPDGIFKSISSDKLQRIDLVRNPWECNCKLLWILQSTKKHVTLGTCATPESLAEKRVRDLPGLLKC